MRVGGSSRATLGLWGWGWLGPGTHLGGPQVLQHSRFRAQGPGQGAVPISAPGPAPRCLAPCASVSITTAWALPMPREAGAGSCSSSKACLVRHYLGAIMKLLLIKLVDFTKKGVE